jgi:hypothetical protein
MITLFDNNQVTEWVTGRTDDPFVVNAMQLLFDVNFNNVVNWQWWNNTRPPLSPGDDGDWMIINENRIKYSEIKWNP